MVRYEKNPCMFLRFYSAQINLVYHINIILRKSNKKSIFGIFLPKFWQTRIFLKNLLRSVFSVYSPLTSCTISEKNNEWILKKSKKRQFLDKPDYIKRYVSINFLVVLVKTQWHQSLQPTKNRNMATDINIYIH